MSLFNLEAAGGWAELNSILMNVPTRDPNDDEDDATGDEDIEDEQDDDEPAVVRDPDDSPRLQDCTPLVAVAIKWPQRFR